MNSNPKRDGFSSPRMGRIEPILASAAAKIGDHIQRIQPMVIQYFSPCQTTESSHWSVEPRDFLKAPAAAVIPMANLPKELTNRFSHMTMNLYRPDVQSFKTLSNVKHSSWELIRCPALVGSKDISVFLKTAYSAMKAKGGMRCRSILHTGGAPWRNHPPKCPKDSGLGIVP